jgi:hypothetical protein
VPHFIIRVSGEITLEEERALRSAGIQRRDAGSATAAYGGELNVVLSFVRASAGSEREARAKVAHILGCNPDDVTARPQRRISGRAGPASDIPFVRQA